MSRAVDIGILALILLSVVMAMVESVAWVRASFRHELQLVEGLVVAVFTAEYILRIWACVEDPEYAGPVSGRLRYALRPMVLVDLVAILPFFLPAFGVDLVAVRVLRMVRIFRVAKLSRYTKALRTLRHVVLARREELGVTLFVGFVLVVGAATVIHAIENPAQPEVFSSIPAACWWAVMTLTTIGYGDMAPVTPLGRFVTSVLSVLSIGLFALPAGIVGSGLVEELARQRAAEGEACSRCGRRG